VLKKSTVYLDCCEIDCLYCGVVIESKSELVLLWYRGSLHLLLLKAEAIFIRTVVIERKSPPGLLWVKKSLSGLLRSSLFLDF
jgi:hypothetical protein